MQKAIRNRNLRMRLSPETCGAFQPYQIIPSRWARVSDLHPDCPVRQGYRGWHTLYLSPLAVRAFYALLYGGRNLRTLRANFWRGAFRELGLRTPEPAGSGRRHLPGISGPEKPNF